MWWIDNSCWSSSSRPPDSVLTLFQNRTKADKTLISIIAEMAFLSPWKQMKVSKPWLSWCDPGQQNGWEVGKMALLRSLSSIFFFPVEKGEFDAASQSNYRAWIVWLTGRLLCPSILPIHACTSAAGLHNHFSLEETKWASLQPSKTTLHNGMDGANNHRTC